MPKFTVTLKRVVYAEVVVEADTAKQAREKIEADGAHDWFVSSNSIGRDTTTIAEVTREPQS